MNLSKLIKSSGKYDLTIFSAESIDRIEKSVFEKNGGRANEVLRGILKQVPIVKKDLRIDI